MPAACGWAVAAVQGGHGAVCLPSSVVLQLLWHGVGGAHGAYQVWLRPGCCAAWGMGHSLVELQCVVQGACPLVLAG